MLLSDRQAIDFDLGFHRGSTEKGGSIVVSTGCKPFRFKPRARSGGWSVDS